MYVYNSELPVDAKNTFHRVTANGVSVLGQHSASQISSAENLGVLIQLICFC